MRKIIPFILAFLMVTALVSPGYGNSPGAAQEDLKVTPPASTAEKVEPLDSNPPEETEPGPEPGPVVTYLIEAQLFPETRKLTAKETLTWRNTTQHPVDYLRFHLYYNAFRNLKTTFMQEGEYYKTYPYPQEQKELKFGEIKITGLRQIGGGELTDNIRFISPDDNNPEDRTVMELKLEKPAAPGQTLYLKIEFVLTIPQIFHRSGAEGDYFFIAQWFPKIGVLQDDGQWNCHQLHFNSEFFADYGAYRVWLTVPGKFVVGATGNLIKTEENADKTRTYIFEEKNIHDFAWTAYPHFTRVVETLQLKGNREPTTIELLLSPGHGAARERYLNALKFALHFLARHIFPYPYKKITVVDPPLKGIGSGGMEYPTLFTAVHFDLPGEAIKMTEAVTIHEIGHQYWYGIVGTDESREAWLDEGVTSFFEVEMMEEYFKGGPLVDSIFIKINDWELDRLGYTLGLSLDPVNHYSWKFLDRFQYGASVYFKAAIFLRTLKNLVGQERIYDFFKYYTEKYTFGHPTTEDFIDAFNTFMGEDFSWAFDQFIRAEKGLDHAVYSVEAVKISSKPDMYRNEAVFLRNEGYFPVDLVITLENGKEVRFSWKEKEKWKKIIFDDPSPLKAAVIDPHYKIPLDRDFLNNSKVRKPAASAIQRLSLKIGFFFQNVLGFLTF